MEINTQAAVMYVSRRLVKRRERTQVNEKMASRQLSLSENFILLQTSAETLGASGAWLPAKLVFSVSFKDVDPPRWAGGGS